MPQEKRINGLTQEFWGIEQTEEGDKVNAQRLIEQYIKIHPIRYAESGNILTREYGKKQTIGTLEESYEE